MCLLSGFLLVLFNFFLSSSVLLFSSCSSRVGIFMGVRSAVLTTWTWWGYNSMLIRYQLRYKRRLRALKKAIITNLQNMETKVLLMNISCKFLKEKNGTINGNSCIRHPLDEAVQVSSHWIVCYEIKQHVQHRHKDHHGGQELRPIHLKHSFPK